MNSLPPPSVEQIINDPATSFWLKKALIEAVERDPLDALNDAVVLSRILQDRFDSLTAHLRRAQG